MKTFTKYLAPLFMALAVGLSMGCATTNAPQWKTTTKGGKVWIDTDKIILVGSNNAKFIWNGAVSTEGYATGEGLLIRSYNDVLMGETEVRVMSGEMKNGKFDGDVLVHYPGALRPKIVRVYQNGTAGDKRSATAEERKAYAARRTAYRSERSAALQRANAERAALQRSRPQPSGGGGLSDGELLGGILTLGGVAGGDAMVTTAGIQMIQGDDTGAVRTLQENDKRLLQEMNSKEGAATKPKGAPAGKPQASKPPARKPANKPNLIEPKYYNLARFRNSNGDQIKYYISAADRAFADYKKTGDERYYVRHKEYADIALQFHKQTSTKGTRIGK